MTAAGVLVVLGVTAWVEMAIRSAALADYRQARQSLRQAASIRRQARDAQLAMLEHRGAFPQRGGEAVERLIRDVEVLQRKLTEVRGASWTEEEQKVLGEIEQQLEGWVAVLRAQGEEEAPGAGSAFWARLQSLDLLTEQLIQLSDVHLSTAQARTRAVDIRRQILHFGSLAAILIMVLLSARWRWQRAQLEVKVAAAEKRGQDLRRMAASIAHEINNQVGALSNALELLGRKLPHEPALAFQRDSLAALEKLTRDFTEFSMPPVGRLEEVDLAELSRAVARPYGPQVEVRANGPVRCLADRSRLGGAVLNIIKNAVEAGGPVQVVVAQEEGGVRLRCLDQGPGILPEHQPLIGEPFFTTKARGTGLGVAVVQQLALAHRGHFSIYNRAERGAEAVLWLPDASAIEPASSKAA